MFLYSFRAELGRYIIHRAVFQSKINCMLNPFKHTHIYTPTNKQTFFKKKRYNNDLKAINYMAEYIGSSFFTVMYMYLENLF